MFESFQKRGGVKLFGTAAVLALTGLVSFQLLGSAVADPAAIFPDNKVALNTPATAPIETPAATPADRKHMLMQYCTACHNDKLKTAGMSVVPLDPENLAANEPTWEKILRRLSLGEMPPKAMPRPPKEQIADFTHWLATALDSMAAANPNPGHSAVRRMNRAEYSNAVRDLLALDMDFAKDLPVDDTGYGFDNIADVLTVSPTLMDRYINVAGKISRLATGQASKKVTTVDDKLTKDLFENAFGVPSYNERASDALPLDSRGGGAFKFYAPYDASYNIQLFLNAGTSTESEIDANNRFEVRVPLKAGLRTIGAYWPKKLALDETCWPGPPPARAPASPAIRCPWHWTFRWMARKCARSRCRRWPKAQCRPGILSARRDADHRRGGPSTSRVRATPPVAARSSSAGPLRRCRKRLAPTGSSPPWRATPIVAR